MCGIFGYSLKLGAFSEGRRAILTTRLAELNDERGGDSWGFVEVSDKAKTPRVERGLGDLGDHAFRMIGATDLFAHTRWATKGAKTVANAHPFEMGHIVGAHNGQIWNHDKLCEKHGRKFEVDSMHLFEHLRVGLPFDEMEGYGAIEWVNTGEHDGINICRMKDGELAVFGLGTHQDTRGVVWSSNKDHLEEALTKAGFTKHFRFDIKEGAVYVVRDGDIYQKMGVSLDLSRDSAPRKTWTRISASATLWPSESWEDADAWSDASRHNRHTRRLGFESLGHEYNWKSYEDWDDDVLEMMADRGDDDAMEELLRRWDADKNKDDDEDEDECSLAGIETVSQNVMVVKNK